MATLLLSGLPDTGIAPGSAPATSRPLISGRPAANSCGVVFSRKSLGGSLIVVYFCVGLNSVYSIGPCGPFFASNMPYFRLSGGWPFTSLGCRGTYPSCLPECTQITGG